MSHQSTLETLDKYLQKGVGRDMALKSIVYPIRLLNYHTVNSETSAILTQLVSNIIDARMLSNSWKGISAYLAGYRTLKSTESMPWYQRALLSLSFFCRMLEQVSGDTGYIQAHIMKHWNKTRIVWHYKFWKTMSLTCSAVLELIKIVSLQLKRRQMRRFVAQSPLTTSPSEHPVQFPIQKKDDGDEENVLNALRWSCLFLFRNVCDMIVYYQWIQSYRPNKNLEYVCGTLSGSIGCWLVWRDIRGNSNGPKP